MFFHDIDVMGSIPRPGQVEHAYRVSSPYL